MATPQDELYFAVRKSSDGHEWIDVNSWGYCAITSNSVSARTNERLPLWSLDNPVVRIARFKLVEIK